jgi:hypothetical protein
VKTLIYFEQCLGHYLPFVHRSAVLIGSFNLKDHCSVVSVFKRRAVAAVLHGEERKLTESTIHFVQHFFGVISFIPISVLVSWLAIFYKNKKELFHL